MNTPFFAEQSRKAEASEPLKALFKINAGLQELQRSQQAESNQAPSGTVAQQIQQQGLAALNQSSEAPGEVIQNVPNTPMGEVAMRANVADQIKAAQQAQLQKQLMQMASQQPQQMARGGIASLSARNMKFQHGGVVGFNGTMGEFVEAPQSEVIDEPKKASDLKKLLAYAGLPVTGAIDVLSLPVNTVRALAAASTPEWKRKAEGSDVSFTPISDALRRAGGVTEDKQEPKPTEGPRLSLEQLRALERQVSQTTPQATPQAAPQAAPAQRLNFPARPSTGGLGSLATALGKVDLSAMEADKKAALDAVNEQQKNLPTAYTTQQLRAEREADAKALGVDLYGAESKARTAALEKEFANQEAARTEANKSRGMDNLITMLTNSGGAPTLFSGLARGTQAYQAAERLQKADDLIWGGKKLEFMDKINNQRELINERNKAMLLGDIATKNDRDEKIRISKNDIQRQIADLQSKSMSEKGLAAIHQATNAVNLSIAQMKAHADAESRKLATESRDINAIESRILENSRINATANKLLDDTFRKNNPAKTAEDDAGFKRSPEEQKKWDAVKSAHEEEKAKQNKFFEDQNYNLQYRKWLLSDRLIGLPEPLKPGTVQASGYNVLGVKKQ
jgi:hypothetical protein